MITEERFAIVNNIKELENNSAELCIVNFNIDQNEDILKNCIKSHPNTTFWIITNDFSKEFVLKASRLGIKNIIKYPIKQETIENFFSEKHRDDSSKEVTYEKLSSSKILIVDDNKLNITLLEEILQDLGVTIKSCTNPCEVIELIDNESYNLFLLDILMPELSGFELAELIKASKLNSNKPIVFISALSNHENILNGYNSGAFSYIEKPFHPNIVKAQIYNILKMQEKNIEEEKIKEHFVATLTHDLKSPISAEITALNYLIKNSVSYNNEILAEMLNSAKYMKLITDNILCHYKQKTKNIILKREPVKLDSLIISSIENLKYLSKNKNINIRYFNNTQNEPINIDPLEIKRVIMNLLANAIEYSKKDGYIDISLTEDTGNITFSIKNYGYGFDTKKHPNIFDEYITLSKTNKKIGFGLGLNICKAIITAHEGKILINSTPKISTEVTFTLPM